MKRLFRCTDMRGFTLIEMVIAMGLFSIAMIIANQAFTNIISSTARYSKMEETNVAGAVGLEIMRHDLEQLGFGLPWGWAYQDATQDPPLVPTAITYSEATDAVGATLNDAPNANNVPRAFVGYAQAGAFSSAYFSIKGTTAGRSAATQYWTYISFNNYSAVPRQSRPVKFASNNPSPGDTVMMINSSPNAPSIDRLLLVKSALANAPFYTAFKTDGSTDSSFLPVNGSSTYMVYGLLGNSEKTPAGAAIDAPRMPFNRADYFIRNSNSPSCAPGTGTLYKATVNQGTTGGDYASFPLLDCVADMEVVLGWDISSSTPPAGSVGAYSSLSTTAGGAVNVATMPSPPVDPNDANAAVTNIQTWLTDAKGLREHLKVVKVYILAQEGRKDTSYKAPGATIEVGDQIEDGGLSPKHNYTLTVPQQQYRWKLYRIAVHPRNLYSNSY